MRKLPKRDGHGKRGNGGQVLTIEADQRCEVIEGRNLTADGGEGAQDRQGMRVVNQSRRCGAGGEGSIGRWG